MSSTPRLKIVAAALLLALVAGSVSAYVLLSPRRTWRLKPNYIVDNRGISSIADGDGGVSKTVSAILHTTASWNGAGALASPVIGASSGSVSGWALGDGTPMLNFRDPVNACTGSCLAATFTGYYTGGRITDADIVTNSTGYQWTSQGEDPNGVGCSNEYYIEGVQVHEIGHGLGIGHSTVAGATMFPSVSACNNNPATIETDDKNAVKDLYNCRFYGTLCDTRYVPAAPCCGGTTCRSPYPNVPAYCL